MLSFNIVKMTKGLLAKKCTRKIVNCYRMFAELREVLVSGRALDKAGLKVNDQLVAYATRFLAVRLKKYVWSHNRALKAKV